MYIPGHALWGSHLCHRQLFSGAWWWTHSVKSNKYTFYVITFLWGQTLSKSFGLTAYQSHTSAFSTLSVQMANNGSTFPCSLNTNKIQFNVDIYQKIYRSCLSSLRHWIASPIVPYCNPYRRLSQIYLHLRNSCSASSFRQQIFPEQDSWETHIKHHDKYRLWTVSIIHQCIVTPLFFMSNGNGRRQCKMVQTSFIFLNDAELRTCGFVQ